jgi:hypothetical protein
MRPRQRLAELPSVHWPMSAGSMCERALQAERHALCDRSRLAYTGAQVAHKNPPVSRVASRTRCGSLVREDVSGRKNASP